MISCVDFFVVERCLQVWKQTQVLQAKRQQKKQTKNTGRKQKEETKKRTKKKAVQQPQNLNREQQKIRLVVFVSQIHLNIYWVVF